MKFVKVTARFLNCRQEPNYDSKVLDIVEQNSIQGLVAIQEDWGQLENGSWIKLEFTAPVEIEEEKIETVEAPVKSLEPKVEESVQKVEGAEKPKKNKEKNRKMRTHKVADKESLWEIAEAYLGNGERYVEIKELNKLTSDILVPGTVLKIPNN